MNSKKIFMTMVMILSFHVSESTAGFFGKYGVRKAAVAVGTGAVLFASGYFALINLNFFNNEPAVNTSKVTTTQAHGMAEKTGSIGMVDAPKDSAEYPAEGIERMRKIQQEENKKLKVAALLLENPEAYKPIKRPVM